MGCFTKIIVEQPILTNQLILICAKVIDTKKEIL